jgi:methylenetetrahydrofolate dehydrogenase (NADP+)/methenyltetrahydrofolate cyclohydrolase
MKLLNGTQLANKKLDLLANQVRRLEKQPALAVILIGDNPASHLYVSLKEKRAKEVGIEIRKYVFPVDADEKEILTCLDFLNNDLDTNGIIVQLPLPTKFSQTRIIKAIDYQKDVDGFHPQNQELFLNDEEKIYPIFPLAIITLIRESQIKADRNKFAIVIGKSDIFDQVMTKALEKEGFSAEFIFGEKVDKNLTKIKKADVVVSACGIPNLLKGEMFQTGAVVIDGGISKVKNKTVGDVDQKSCLKKDILLSPVPGGVGPLTIACLLESVVKLS